MRQLSCKAMGADCGFVAKGENDDEVMRKMMDHARKDHPDTWAEMEQMSKEEKDKMMMDMKSKIMDA